METKVIKKVSELELVVILNGIEKPTLCNVVMETEFQMLKTNNPFYDKPTKSWINKYTKLSSRNYMIGGSYEQRVNNNREKEDKERDFESEKPSGKTHISKVVLIDDKTQSTHYVMLEYYTKVKPTVTIQKNGNELTDPIELELLNTFKQSSGGSYGKQELEKEVTVITPKLLNIKSITMYGTVYEIEK
jgi:hypothetical protein